jgi:hypothetical protein
MLDTAFPRPVGDVGNPASWPFPVLYHRVPGATARRVVDGDVMPLLDAFVAGAETLVRLGAVGIITSCGFLARFQSELSTRIAVPLMTSSLLLLPALAASLRPGRRVGVLTYDAAALTTVQVRDIGGDLATPVAGLPPDGAFHAMIERGGPYRADDLRAEVLGAARALIQRGDIGALLLECTNLPPFAPSLRTATGLPVHDILTLGAWFRAGLVAA